MGLPARKLATYEDLFDLPDNVVGEVLAGELYTSPRPAGPHAVAASTLTMDLGNPFHRGRGGPGGWWILIEPEIHFESGDILVPDLAGWRKERMPERPSEPFFTLVPDWVCEVISPSSLRQDRIRKLPIYAREGVGHAWLVDPLARTLEIYRHQEGRWLLVGSHGGDEWVRGEPFEAVALDLLGLWGEDRPPGDAPDSEGGAP